MLLIVALPACKGKSAGQSTASLSTEQVDSAIIKGTFPVMDYAKLLSKADLDAINKVIIDLDSNHVAQVAVVTTTDLEGKNVHDFATGFGNKWGVGHKDNNDGITIVIKPKTGDDPEQRGQAAIATGIGMEKILNDEMCKRIIDEIMIPEFKNNNYGEGIKKALSHIKTTLAKQDK